MSTVVAACIAAGASVVVGILTLIGVMITNNKSNRDIEHKLETAQAVTNTEIKELTREVREHNGFFNKIPVIEEKIRVINRRLDDLEKGRVDKYDKSKV